MWRELWVLPRNVAIGLMIGYRRVISPMYGQVCRYHPSCSRYSLEAYQQQGLFAGFALAVWRLLRCNPFSSGGIDDPPQGLKPYLTLDSRGFVRPHDRKA